MGRAAERVQAAHGEPGPDSVREGKLAHFTFPLFNRAHIRQIEVFTKFL